MTGDKSGEIIKQITKEGDLSFQWPEVVDKDRENIRRFLQRRREGGADDDELRHDFSVLVGLAAREADGPLSSERLCNFEEPANRPGRALAHFLVFVGAEAPLCPKCGEQDYQPVEENPEEMRCRGCTFLFTDRELAHMAYSHSHER